MAAGMGAGIAAIFRAPLAGALFAAEVLYSSPDFESDVIIPACLASVTAYSTFGLVFGWAPLFTIAPELLEVLRFENPLELFPYLLLALLMVAMASLYMRSFYGLIDVFHSADRCRGTFGRLSVRRPAAWWPCCCTTLSDAISKCSRSCRSAMASCRTGLTCRPAASSAFTWALCCMAVALGKILTTSLTIGSGGSGGVFGPSMVIGGCGGGALGIWLHRSGRRLVPHPASFVIVGMAGFFAAAAKTPFPRW